MDLNINIVQTIIYTVVSVVVGLLLEFLVFGGDYSRTERLEYEDDEYYYYVKAVPKAAVATSERSIKKINAEPVKEDTAVEDQVVSYANPIFHGEILHHSRLQMQCLWSGRMRWILQILRKTWKNL